MKVPGRLSLCNEHLTKMLPLFLTRLNEISEGCETTVTVVALDLCKRLNAALNAWNWSGIALLIATWREYLLYNDVHCNFNKVFAKVN